MSGHSSVDLIWLGAAQSVPEWTLGKVYSVEATPRAVYTLTQRQLADSQAQAWLFWDARLGVPDMTIVAKILDRPGDLWHAGLKLGVQRYPRLLSYVNPGWMLGTSLDVGMEGTSWRVSLRACLVRRSVLSRTRGLCATFDGLDAAALEWGYRCIKHGVVTRYVPQLVPANVAGISIAEISLEDEFRFLRRRFAKIWSKWVVIRLGLSKPFLLFQTIRSYRKATECLCDVCRCGNELFQETVLASEDRDPGITVILPTRCRYSYLENCLETLRQQSIHIREIICVDQTPSKQRNHALYARFNDLPLRVIWQDISGQSVARNAALREAKTEWLFFADDDSEYLPDTLEQHLRLVLTYRADGSTGISLPPHEYVLPKEYQYVRIAHNLDTGNALIRREAVLKAGGFDGNFNFGKGADTDLGMRLYLNGCLIMHNPQAKRLHFKAESGGLRDFGVLWENRTKSRFQPWPAPTYLYWLMTYFPKNTWLEVILHNCLFRFVGPPNARFGARLWHMSKELLFLPITCLQLIRSIRKARIFFKIGPRLLQDSGDT